MDNLKLSMGDVDIVIAGGGVSGLLIASALAGKANVVLVEQNDSLPKNKYWLTSDSVLQQNQDLKECIDSNYSFLDFIAYDGLCARVAGGYCLWNTAKLIGTLENRVRSKGGTILTGHRLYSFSDTSDCIALRINDKELKASLLVDCMGFGSPIVGAKCVADIQGYYIVYGREVTLKQEPPPIGLDNVVINKQPAFFELFPTANQTAHAAIILPSRHFRPERMIRDEFSFIIERSHYSKYIEAEKWNDSAYFGIVPVGRLKTQALNRIVFFGESGQANPAASATGLTRMLLTYKGLALALLKCLDENNLSKTALLSAIPRYMSPMNRAFQESLFESLLDFGSDDFKCLVQDMKDYPANAVYDMLFADFNFQTGNSFRFALDALLRPKGVFGKTILKSSGRYLFRSK